MAKIPENILNDIQDRCDIVEVISSYIPLRPAGRNFKTLCPFHHEKTPSFIVSPDKQIYHCFGCNSGGNVFNFIKEYEKIDFIDAVRMLAEKTGVKLPAFNIKKNADDFSSSTLYSINDIAAKFYSASLERFGPDSEIRHYIEKRGLEEDIIKKFGLGYADPSWRALTDFLSKRGIKTELAVNSGLVQNGKDESSYDLFRNRLMFPISDVRNRIVGFGARVLDESIPKYINSPETVIYKKGQHLYGLNFAKIHIKEKGFAIITEGYLDTITSHQYGVANTISSLGTALTIDQIRLLKRYTHNVMIVYDADQAGEMATLRGLDLFLEEGMNVKVAILEKGHDPDTYIRKFGPRGFSIVVERAKGLFAYKLDILKKRLNINEPEGKAEIVKEMLATISKMRNAVIKAEYIKKLAEELFIKEDAIWDELRKIKDDSKRYEPRTPNPEPRTMISIPPAEKILAKLMLEDLNVVNMLKGDLQPFDFKNPDIRHLVEVLFTLDIDSGSIDAGRLINYLEDKVPSNVVSYIVNEEIDIRDKEKNIMDCIRAIKKGQRDDRLRDIQNRLTKAQENGYGEEAKSLLEEFNRLIKNRMRT